MGYFLFRCPGCIHDLVLGDVSFGASYTCPSCQAVHDAPQPDLRFPCNSCGCDLFVPQDLKGSAFVCPNCEISMVIEDDYYAEVQSQQVSCPGCGKDIFIPPLVAASAAKGDQRSLAKKTLKLDNLLEGIPQLRSLEKGLCPYCESKLEKGAGGAFVCRRCQRVITTLKRSLRRS